MVIESRTMVGAVGAFAVVGAALWFSLSLSSQPAAHKGTVEVQQIEERSWAVEVRDLGAGSTSTNR